MGAGDRLEMGGATGQPINFGRTGRSRGMQGRQSGRKTHGATSHSDAFSDESIRRSSLLLKK